MEDYTKKCTKTGKKLLKTLPAQIEAMSTFVDSLAKEPAEVRSMMAAAAEQSRLDGSCNKAMSAILCDVQTHLLKTIDSLQTLERWITLNVPTMEDGGNFGADVQAAALKVVTTQRTELAKLLATLPDYHKDRAAALKDAVTTDQSKVTKSSSSTSKTKGGKADEAGDKVTESSSTDETSTTKAVLADYISFLVMVDTKWYFQFKTIATANLDGLAFVCDVVTKNKEKINKPKGENRGGGGYTY